MAFQIELANLSGAKLLAAEIAQTNVMTAIEEVKKQVQMREEYAEDMARKKRERRESAERWMKGLAVRVSYLFHSRIEIHANRSVG